MRCVFAKKMLYHPRKIEQTSNRLERLLLEIIFSRGRLWKQNQEYYI